VYKLLYLESERGKKGRWAERRLKGFGDVERGAREEVLQERYAPRTTNAYTYILTRPAKVEAENLKIAELQSKLFHAEMEALRLGWYLKRMEEENRRLQEMLQAAALGQAWGGGGPGTRSRRFWSRPGWNWSSSPPPTPSPWGP
jgi:hypothetical protein